MRFTTIAVAAALLTAGSAIAETVAPSDVMYDDYGAVKVSLSGNTGNAAEGAKIMASKQRGNCLSCHEVTALKDTPFHGEVGPLLDGVGSRWEAAEMRGIVANAKKTYEGTAMPAFYKTEGFIRPGNAYTGKAPTEALTPLLSAQDIEDVVAFLLTLKDE